MTAKNWKYNSRDQNKKGHKMAKTRLERRKQTKAELGMGVGRGYCLAESREL